MSAADTERWTPDWANVPDASVPHLLLEAKEQLRDIVAMGINSDQRSVALGGVFGGGAFALFTLSATVFSGVHRANTSQINALQWAPFASGFFFMIASALCLAAAIPGDFYLSGYEPRNLIHAASDILWMQIYAMEDIQRRIDANLDSLARAAELIKWAIWFGFGGLLAGTLIFVAGFLVAEDGAEKASHASLAMAGMTFLMIVLLAFLFHESRQP